MCIVMALLANIPFILPCSCGGGWERKIDRYNIPRSHLYPNDRTRRTQTLNSASASSQVLQALRILVVFRWRSGVCQEPVRSRQDSFAGCVLGWLARLVAISWRRMLPPNALNTIQGCSLVKMHSAEEHFMPGWPSPITDHLDIVTTGEDDNRAGTCYPWCGQGMWQQAIRQLDAKSES